MTTIFLGKPPANIEAWIKAHSQPAGHADTWYKYENDTEWRHVNIEGTLKLVNMGQSTGQIENPYDIVAIEIGENVTDIGQYAFEDTTRLTSITIPGNMTNILDYAFSYCSGITSITIPECVTNIGAYAFHACSSLTSVTIPDSVTYIGEGAFAYCSRLTSVTITANGGNAANVKQMMINAGVSESITWNMPN